MRRRTDIGHLQNIPDAKTVLHTYDQHYALHSDHKAAVKTAREKATEINSKLKSKLKSIN
jgi:hypothetical protein